MAAPASLPFDAGSAPPEELMEQMREAAQDYPYLTEMAAHSADPGYSFSAEFEVGLALVLDGLASLRSRSH